MLPNTNLSDHQVQNNEAIQRELNEYCVEMIRRISSEDPNLQSTMNRMFEVLKCYTTYISLRLWEDMDRIAQEQQLIEVEYQGKLLTYQDMFSYWIKRFLETPFKMEQYQQVINAYFAIKRAFRILNYTVINEQPEIQDFNKKISFYYNEAQLQESNKQVMQFSKISTGIKDKILTYSQDINQTNERTTVLHISEHIMRYVFNELKIQTCSPRKFSDEYHSYVVNSIKNIMTSTLVCHISNPSLYKIKEQGSLYDSITSLIIEHLFSFLPLLKPEEFVELCKNIEESLASVEQINTSSNIIKLLLLSLRSKLENFKISYPELYAKIFTYHEKSLEFEKNVLLARKKALNECLKIIPSVYTNISAIYKQQLSVADSFIKQHTDANDLIQQIKKKSSKFNKDALYKHVYIQALKYVDDAYLYFFGEVASPVHYIEYGQAFSFNIARLFEERMNQASSWILEKPKKVFDYCQALEAFLTDNQMSMVVAPDCFHSTMYSILNRKCDAYRLWIVNNKLMNNEQLLALGAKIFEQYVCNANPPGVDVSNIHARCIYLTDMICGLINYSFIPGNPEKNNLEAAKKYLARGLEILPKDKVLLDLNNYLEFHFFKNEMFQPNNHAEVAEQLNINIIAIDALPEDPNNTYPNLIAEYKKLSTKQVEFEKQSTLLAQDKLLVRKFIEEYNVSFAILSKLILNDYSPLNFNEIQAKYKKLTLLKEKIANTYKSIQDRTKRINSLKQDFETLYNAYTQSVSNVKVNDQPKPPAKKSQPNLHQAAKKEAKNQRRLENKSKREAEEKQQAENKPLAPVIEPTKISKSALKKQKRLQREAEKNQLEENKVPQIPLSANDNEKTAVHETMVAMPATANVDLNTLNRFDFLKLLDTKLREKGAKLTIKGSITNVFGIRCFNKNPDRANNFPVNDIDIKILFNEHLNITEINKILLDFGFQSDYLTSNPECFKYSKLQNGQEIDLSFIVSNSYHFPADHIIWRMGQAEFADDAQLSNAPVNSKNEVLVGFENHSFKLTLPTGECTDDYISACQFKELRILKPAPEFRSFCYTAYKYATKLSKCGVDVFSLNVDSKKPSSVFYHQLTNELVNYFDRSIDRYFYWELKVFMSKGVTQDTQHIAAPLLNAFYISYLKKNNTDLSINVITDLAKLCTLDFLNKYCLPEIKLESNQLGLDRIESSFNTIAEEIVRQHKSPKLSRSPTGLFHNSPSFTPQSMRLANQSSNMSNNGANK